MLATNELAHESIAGNVDEFIQVVKAKIDSREFRWEDVYLSFEWQAYGIKKIQECLSLSSG